MSAVLDRIPEDQIARARATDLLALAERHTQMRKVAAREHAGPCPRCGGIDRFHVKGDWFFCRQCNSKGGDAIDFVRWMQPGLSFVEAVAQLTGGSLPAAPVKRSPAPAPAKSQPADWRANAERIAAEAHDLLWTAEGKPAQAYLESRGIEPHTWLTFGLGYRPNTPLAGTKGKLRAPAIVMPWRSRAGVFALRYRFLEAQNYVDIDGKERSEKLVAETGSQFAGKLYGGQGLPDWVLPLPKPGENGLHRFCTLLIVEGEINAMSCWQVAGETQLHVCSLGSESQSIPDEAVRLAACYGQILVWADREQVAQRLMARLPGAVGIKSPGGKDANDLLREGLLGGFLATMRANGAKNRDELEGLLWALYDAARLPAGIDTGSAKVLQRLAAQLGRKAAIYEPEPNRWITVDP